MVRALSFSWLLLIASCGDTPPAEDAAPDPADAPTHAPADATGTPDAPDSDAPSAFDELCRCLLDRPDGRFHLDGPEVTGTTPTTLPEVSGIVTSRFDDDVFWAHNDSGHAAELFAIAANGDTLARVAFPTLRNRDWEELARGPCDDDDRDRACLYIGDVGDNASAYASVFVHRWREPDPRGAPTSADDVESAELVFPDGARDTEAFVVDDHGVLWLLTKRPPIGHIRVYSAPFRPGEATTLTFHEEIPLSRVERIASVSMFTAADLHPRCGALIGRYYGGAFFAFVDPLRLETLAERDLHSVPTGAERQGEAIAWTSDGYWHVGEATGAPIQRFRCRPAD